jgi:hypothetical protein
MGYDVVPSDGLPVKLDRQTNKYIAELQRRTVMVQANNRASEATPAAQIRDRLASGAELTHEATMYVGAISSHITHTARGNPGLEASLRGNLQESYEVAAGILIARYMMRPL